MFQRLPWSVSSLVLTTIPARQLCFLWPSIQCRVRECCLDARASSLALTIKCRMTARLTQCVHDVSDSCKARRISCIRQALLAIIVVFASSDTSIISTFGSDLVDASIFEDQEKTGVCLPRSTLWFESQDSLHPDTRRKGSTGCCSSSCLFPCDSFSASYAGRPLFFGCIAYEYLIII